MKHALTLALCLSLATAAQAQVCKTGSIAETSNPERFVNHLDGTITDVETGLRWSVCAVGQTYSDDGDCSGAPTSLTWLNALQAAQGLNHAGGLAGFADWRVPNIKELGSIVEFQCHSPAINQQVFPGTPSTTFWSSTPDPRPGKQARAIYFATGSDLTPEVSSLRHVRLVRSAD